MAGEGITPAQLFVARQLLRWTRRQLAEHVSVSLKCIQIYEVSGEISEGLVPQKVREAFEAAGVEFIAENGEGPGVRLRKSS